ncbi:MAG TPA: lipase maturation factor family protein [Polyangiaceae bacterium]|nr:lipase maturation factor family protein [Polyangiaceae bacterium]
MSPPRGVDLVARLFQRWLGVTFVVAWVSLGMQIDVLVGSRGLLPAKDLFDALKEHPDVTFFDAPTIFRWGASDGALHAGIYAGVVLGSFIVLGVVPRVALAVSTLLYLSYAVVARTFLSFQWDNLLLECGFLAVFLPTKRRSRWAMFLLELLLFKLYFESGIAKYESYLGDWKDGTAMTYYYETAPIPTRLAWYAHHSPPWFHALESRATLAFEVLVPFLVFGPRPARLVALFVFTGFQLVNIATANYGFFSYLALVLGLVLLDASDVRRLHAASRRIAKRLPPSLSSLHRALRRARVVHRLALRRAARAGSRMTKPLKPRDDTIAYLARLSVASAVSFVYVVVSLSEGLGNFARDAVTEPPGASLAAVFAPFRIIDTYHLFGSITRDRIEPTFETFDGARWTEHDLHYKPGDPQRPPPFVAPHQPRVDFQLWFYGLNADRGVPTYVAALLQRLCTDPNAVAPLFVGPLPLSPKAARVSFYRYHFTTAAERRATGAWWKREPSYLPRTLQCELVRHDAGAE